MTNKFQFLIGRLKTNHAGERQIYFIVFQFLIGRLKTNLRESGNIEQDLFQFLIGRLKTMFVKMLPD